MKRTVVLAVCMLLLLLSTHAVLANQRTIVKVHRGDIVELEGGWKARIVGVRAADLDDPYGQKAFQYAQKALEGQRVAFFSWTKDNTAAGIVYGEDGLPFATVEYGPKRKDFGAELVSMGLAEVDTEHMPEYVEHYADLQKKAMAKQNGMWRDVKPAKVRKAAQ
ncbi:thermonuclease family protein [bacterium]|nr:thermonuclease family protein [bacterium]